MPETAVSFLFERYGPKYRTFVTFTVVLGIVSMLLNATMINVAIPIIMGAFGVGQGTAHWLATGYIASMTVAMLLNDWFVRSFGMRTTYLGAMAIFAIVLAWLFISWRATKGPKPAFDWTGLSLLVVFVFSILIALSSGQREGWYTPIVAVYFSTFALAFVAFLWREWWVPGPILQLRLIF